MAETLISRKLLFGNPERALAHISPDGESVAFLAPLNGVLNVWVAPRDDLQQARPVTNDTGRGIRFYTWTYSGKYLLYIQDKNGDENWHLYRVDLAYYDEVSDLTPYEGVQARVQAISHRRPGEVIVAINNRVPELHDLYTLDLASGKMTLLLQNEGFLDFFLDHDLRLVAAVRMTPDGGIDMMRQDDQGNWQTFGHIPADDMITTNVFGVDKTGQVLFMQDSRDRDTAALVSYDLRTGQRTLIAEDERADATGIVQHPTEKNLQAGIFTYDRQRWQVFDPAFADDLAYLKTVRDGEISIQSRSLDDRYWMMLYTIDNGPARYYLYDRTARQAHFLFTTRPELENYQLACMFPAFIRSRDGLNLVAYYTLPVGSDSNGDGIPDQPLPMVFNPHGGPWGRDFWGFNPWHQWLANRGYAVMCVNFRSSVGFGKSFTNAGNREWGGKIMEDQVDAVQWAVGRGIADPQRIAVMGGSFGGYSTLAGVTMYPELFAVGVDLVGPANLITLLESMPPYWKPMLEMFTTRVGDFRTEEGRALLKKHSPLTYAERICKPLLIGQGANDPRVKQAESDQIVSALQAKEIPVTYLLYPDEGHGFARPENNLSFYAVAEAFLSKYLGGSFEPIGDDFQGSSLQFLSGKEYIPGLD